MIGRILRHTQTPSDSDRTNHCCILAGVPKTAMLLQHRVAKAAVPSRVSVATLFVFQRERSCWRPTHTANTTIPRQGRDPKTAGRHKLAPPFLVPLAGALHWEPVPVLQPAVPTPMKAIDVANTISPSQSTT